MRWFNQSAPTCHRSSAKLIYQPSISINYPCRLIQTSSKIACPKNLMDNGYNIHHHILIGGAQEQIILSRNHPATPLTTPPQCPSQMTKNKLSNLHLPIWRFPIHGCTPSHHPRGFSIINRSASLGYPLLWKITLFDGHINSKCFKWPFSTFLLYVHKRVNVPSQTGHVDFQGKTPSHHPPSERWDIFDELQPSIARLGIPRF